MLGQDLRPGSQDPRPRLLAQGRREAADRPDGRERRGPSRVGRVDRVRGAHRRDREQGPPDGLPLHSVTYLSPK